MLNLTSKDKPDSFEYFTNLSYDRRVFFDREKVINTMVYERALSETELKLSVDSLCSGIGEGGMSLGDMDKFGGSRVSKDIILQYLSNEVGPRRQHMLMLYDKKTKKNRYSLDKNFILTPLFENGIATEFLSEFISFREHKKAASDMQRIVSERFEDTGVDGISSLSYDWTRALTGRLYTSNENIQNIAKLYLNAMRGPTDDYVLVWGDFDQIDLRVAYYTVISESRADDEIFEQYEDKYEAIARIIDKKLGRQFNIDNFKDNRKKYKRGILARCYGQQLSQLTSTVGDKDFAIMLDKYYNENDRYSSWYSSVIDKIRDVDSVDIYTYFGNVNHVPLSDCNTGEQMADRVLNCPIQSTSNDIIMHMVNKTVREFRALGINEDKFRVYMVRHDEPIFLMHKSCLKYLPIIRNNTVLQIDDWGPVTMTLDVGKYYTESEAEKYKDYFGVDDVSVGAVKVPRSTYYNPFTSPDLTPEEYAHTEISIIEFNDGYSLCIGDCKYSLDMKKHIRNQIYEYLSEYVHNVQNSVTCTFRISEDFPVKLYNVFVNDVYLYFIKKGD